MNKTTETKYIEAVGRRKVAVARVRLFTDKELTFKINDRDFEVYFPLKEHQEMIKNAFKESGLEQNFFVSAKIKGGGQSAQAEALRHGISRALVKYEPETRGKLKKEGMLKRDSRQKERRKFGLKKARKAPQWSKR